MRVEIADPLYEQLVADGKAKRIDFEESCKLAYKRGGMRRIVVARVKYQVIGKDGETAHRHGADATGRRSPARSPRSSVALRAYHHAQVRPGHAAVPDRVQLCARWLPGRPRHDVPVGRGCGATCGATVAHAARQEALASAFCIATDATGVLVQPIRTHEKVRQACRRGHYFVHVADKDHIFFDYTAKETGAAVAEMFKGYSGYVQADAKSVYDVLFREPSDKPPDDDDGVRREVGCLAHCRRKFWEAAIAKNVVAREALVRLGRIFELDASWRGRSPAEIKRLRDAHLRPHMQAFFAWAELEFEKVKEQRGSIRSALGYAVRQKDALLRVLDDGRLILENNRSERALRGSIAIGRKAWLFVGSDDHAQSAGNLFSLVASCQLHGLDPETYLRDLFRVLAHWPKDRYLELAPKYWAATRARLDPNELRREFGPLALPQPICAAAEEKRPANLAP